MRTLAFIPEQLQVVLEGMLEENGSNRLSALDCLGLLLQAFPEACTEERRTLYHKLKEDPERDFFEMVKDHGYQEASRKRYAQFLEKNMKYLMQRGYSPQTIWALYVSGDYRTLGVEL